MLDRVARGASMTITRDGAEVAELRPLRKRAVPAAELVAAWRLLPSVDADELRRDLDAVVDPSW
ncbi:hypothetical protein SAMN06264364_1053 [Quadrisphaera granulorum]|uniref:Prevent-host-death family protein n=1 Tax=Quadrisphaera granulorum TaxID=317664 RepID=A0A316ABK4_9ACTN|nr:type II toxin-antitoxin system prevent-host-death family antitoxin [Quadrisphaera granulorum]PWJ54799.1 hypothetical protein BXY45_1053 [Quadrisphaera granulorum]SZE95745.1 hypothetical protein SAMN06264364_1053 [Quadrisphaera granulorum]